MNDILTVLMILATIFVLFCSPDYYNSRLLGFWGALIGVVIGLLVQFGDK